MSKLVPMSRTEDPSPAPRVRPGVLATLLGLTVLFSLLPWILIERGLDRDAYLWGFSPILPLCLYGAAFLQSRILAFTLPVLAWVTQGFVQAAYWGSWSAGFAPVMLWVYAALLAAAGLGLWLRRDRRPATIAGIGLGSGVAFFLVTNFGVWLGGDLYPPTAAGLLECYAAGLPFFRGTLLSLVVFLPVLFAPAAVRFPAAFRQSIATAG